MVQTPVLIAGTCSSINVLAVPGNYRSTIILTVLELDQRVVSAAILSLPRGVDVAVDFRKQSLRCVVQVCCIVLCL